VHIDIRIPYEPDFKLGTAYNRIMRNVEDWVLILDTDVFVALIPDWYDRCLKAIEKVGDTAGWITCLTNRIGCPHQKYPHEVSDDITDHMIVARDLALQNDGIIVDITAHKPHMSGFFILTRRRCWEAVGPFPEKFLGLDNWYGDRLREKGFTLHVMQDLYVYHAYHRLWKGK